jgi:hypothetical protein
MPQPSRLNASPRLGSFFIVNKLCVDRLGAATYFSDDLAVCGLLHLEWSLNCSDEVSCHKTSLRVTVAPSSWPWATASDTAHLSRVSAARGVFSAASARSMRRSMTVSGAFATRSARPAHSTPSLKFMHRHSQSICQKVSSKRCQSVFRRGFSCCREGMLTGATAA